MAKFARPSLLLCDVGHSPNAANPSRDVRKVFFAVYRIHNYNYVVFVKVIYIHVQLYMYVSLCVY